MDATADISLDAANIHGDTDSNTCSIGGGAMRSQAAAKAARRTRRQSPTPKSAAPKPAPSPIEVAVAGYAPTKEPAKSAWPAIGDTVRSLVLGADPGSEEMALKLVRSLSRHIALRHKAGMSLTDLADLLSDQALAATFAASGLKRSSEGTLRGHVERVRAAALPDRYGRPAELKRGRTPIAQWYSDDDVEALLRWARNTSQVAGPGVRGALLLGLSAGLDGFEVHSVTGSCIQRTEWGLVVAAPGMGQGKSRPARLVPVLAQHERELAEVALAAGAGPLAGQRVASTRSTSGLAEAVAKTDGLPRFDLARARALWTRRHLEAGVSYVALKQAGASTGSCALDDFAVGIKVHFEGYVTTLRRGDKPFDSSAFTHVPAATDPA